jgi:aspartyl-tRNA(Asn)/glutamyl-tRNA(Gln) amidotransferase subunit A
LEVFDDALDQADEADRRIANGEDTPLLGIPLAIKDNILILDKHATAGSKILDGFVSPYDSTVVNKLKEAGAVLIGRTNMDEFGMGTSTENSAYGPTKNPHDTERVAGGSSGGSAAAVAACMALGAFGSDTGGSCRQPAALCGVVGFKPTYGKVSRYGLIALGSSLDQIGEFGKNVSDVEALYSVVKGRDKMDSTSI